jgi:serine/threonine-protein kinase SRPK3
MVALLGNPPRALLDIGKSSRKFFTDQGQSIVTQRGAVPCRSALLSPGVKFLLTFPGTLHEDIARPEKTSLESRETSLEGESRDKFLKMMRRMLQWEPSKRATARELAEDDWIMQYM